MASSKSSPSYFIHKKRPDQNTKVYNKDLSLSICQLRVELLDKAPTYSQIRI